MNSGGDEDIGILDRIPQPHIIDKNRFVRLADIMTVNLLVNDKSEIMLLHDKQFPILLKYAEFDPERCILNFIDHRGRSVELGIPIPPVLSNQIVQNSDMKTVLLKNNEIADFYFIPLIIQVSRKENTHELD